MDFTKFQLDSRILSAVQALGYKEPTPIQAQAIPLILQKKDVIGLAQTGTGKTAAFVLPLLHQLLEGNRGQLRGLIIVPTRELANQINDAIKALSRSTGLRSITLYGGVGFGEQFRNLRRGVDIIIACPGRLLDHIDRGTVVLKHLQTLVLDEADQMFDFGFFPTIRKILQHLPTSRQSLLFSATMPKAIRTLAEEILSNPVSVQIGRLAPAITVEQKLYPVTESLKTELLIKLLQINQLESVLIFTRTKIRAKRLAEQLGTLGYSATSFQGNLPQSKRQTTLQHFRTGALKILVATDIAARGIDVANVSHVINFDMPATTEAYTHRIGRTGRASKLGAAFTLITTSDRHQIRAIERQLNQTIEKCTVSDFNYSASPTMSHVTDEDTRLARPYTNRFRTHAANPSKKKSFSDAKSSDNAFQTRVRPWHAGPPKKRFKSKSQA